MSRSQMSAFADSIYKQKYAFKDSQGAPTEEWSNTAERVGVTVMGALGYASDSPETRRIVRFIAERKFMPGGRYLYATGRPLHQVSNCVLGRPEDSREGWADWLYKTAMTLQTGAGLGGEYSLIRPKGSPIKRTGGLASGPISLMKMTNESGREIMQGGDRRSAIWAGLKWWHQDCKEFIHVKDWSPELRALKADDITFPLPMEFTNISVGLDDEFFTAINDASHPKHALAKDIYWDAIKQMFKKGEPGFSIDIGENAGEDLRNACSEVTSRDDSDICNLGSLNLARIESLEEMREVVEAGTLFLLAGSVYSDLPYAKIAETREKNRRLGLGLMGIHEWLLVRNYRYEPTDELAKWLEVYATSTDVAHRYADKHGLSRPIKTRAIAPTGTIGIVAETTTGIEPIFCVAYKRRYLKHGKWMYQYVIDPTARRLIESGIDPDKIEDAYTLSLDIERRIAFQAFVQRYVDHAISSTLNMPKWGTAANNEETLSDYGQIMLRYLPQLRGITVYPDAARGGQPLSPVPYEVAVKKEGVVFEESAERCVGGVCGA